MNTPPLTTHAQLLANFDLKGEPSCPGLLWYLGSCWVVLADPSSATGKRLAEEYVALCNGCDRLVFTRPFEKRDRYQCVPRAACARPRPRRPR